MRMSRGSARLVAAAFLAVGSVTASAGAAQAATTAPAGSTLRDASALDPGNYPWQNGDRSAADGHGYYQKSCVSFAAWAIRHDGLAHSTSPDYLGDARLWRGAATDAAPRVGDIAQWDAGVNGADDHGHVAYVAAVHPDGTIEVYEYNWTDDYDHYRAGRLSVRTIPATDPSRYLRF